MKHTVQLAVALVVVAAAVGDTVTDKVMGPYLDLVFENHFCYIKYKEWSVYYNL